MPHPDMNDDQEMRAASVCLKFPIKLVLLTIPLNVALNIFASHNWEEIDHRNVVPPRSLACIMHANSILQFFYTQAHRYDQGWGNHSKSVLPLLTTHREARSKTLMDRNRG